MLIHRLMSWWKPHGMWQVRIQHPTLVLMGCYPPETQDLAYIAAQVAAFATGRDKQEVEPTTKILRHRSLARAGPLWDNDRPHPWRMGGMFRLRDDGLIMRRQVLTEMVKRALWQPYAEFPKVPGWEEGPEAQLKGLQWFLHVFPKARLTKNGQKLYDTLLSKLRGAEPSEDVPGV